MKLSTIDSPLAFLRAQLPASPVDETLSGVESWWHDEGMSISHGLDQQGTPALKMFNALGSRVDQIVLPASRGAVLQKVYDDGAVWRVFQQNDVMPFYERAYVHGFYDSGLVSSITGTLQTALLIQKYGSQDLHFRYLSKLLKHDENHWQGAFWSSEIKGGSDPGSSIETRATLEQGKWQLNGSKYFATTPEAELAIVVARLPSGDFGTRNLALFAVPHKKENGDLNFHIRRLKQKIGGRTSLTAELEFSNTEAWLIGDPERGYDMMGETTAVGRLARSLAAMALAQRAISDAAQYASTRIVFGRPAIDQPLMRQQFRHRMSVLHAGFRLAWEPVELLGSIWRLKPPYSERYQLYRLVTFLAKYWSTEFAVQSAKWNMEVQAGNAVFDNADAERWLRDAMTLTAMDGTNHRQILNAIKLLQKHPVCDALFEHLEPFAPPELLTKMKRRTDDFLHQSIARQEETAEPLIKELSWFMARALIRKTGPVTAQ